VESNVANEREWTPRESTAHDRAMAGDETVRITITQNGPYRVTGSVPLAVQRIVTNQDGESIDWQQGRLFDTDDEYRLCRCGHAATKPFCDESCVRLGFDGTETASRKPYLALADEDAGPIVSLTDAPSLCARARFCVVGDSIWRLVAREDEESISLAVLEGTRCPSGRLVVWNRRTAAPFEPDLQPSIGLIEGPAAGLSGPIWVRGGIPVVSADGFEYETRNRVTLCRCGASRNKPFCNGSHAAIGFDDGLDVSPAD
jgi:CDGSH-type Zn-finger protein